MIEKEITVFHDTIKDGDCLEIVTTEPAIGHVVKHDLSRMTEQKNGPIKDRLRPCAYCGKKDRIRVEYRYRDVGHSEPMRFYRIRCMRPLCRFRDIFYPYGGDNFDLNYLIKDWNDHYSKKEMGHDWKELE